MSWKKIIKTVSEIAELSSFSVREISKIAGCEFVETSDGRNVTEHPPVFVRNIEIKLGKSKEIVILSLAENEDFNLKVKEFGEPLNIDIVSPPLSFGEETIEIGWERKYSVCYPMKNCLVWFSIEQRKSKEYLVSISIHNEIGQ